MYVKKVIICDDKNKFPIKEILEGYNSFNTQEETRPNVPDIYTFICDNGTMLLQQAVDGAWRDVPDVYINNDNKNSCATSFVDQIDRWATNGTAEEVVLVCMDFYWSNQRLYNEEFRDLIIEKINNKNNNRLKMIIYTTAAQQMADRFVAAKQDSASSALIGAASYDISKNGSESKWKNIFKSVNKLINK